ncbi:hypothetical protein [Burkholderia ubonensis]|uniref:hypothetical protein n=1 Tax=Burkholderia ubonensis TaxID=101571 RepID=UPI000B21CB03|nr:hypothetical protein [Burkholderia ubonensis]
MKKTKLDVWAEKHPRLFWALILLIVDSVAIACLPGLAPEGCRSWSTLLTCSNLPSLPESLQAAAWYLAIVASGPAAFELSRLRRGTPPENQ